MHSQNAFQLAVFPTDLGWSALAGKESVVCQVIFAYPSRAAALAALNADLVADAQPADAWDWLIERLEDYAAGRTVNFSDVRLNLDHLTDFQRRVVKHCRAISYGKTQSYGDLAAKSGSPRAARAVGSTMAGNRFPVIVPCHRVINSNGTIGRYSAPDGPRMKSQLLDLEQGISIARHRPKPSGRLSSPRLTRR